MSKARVLVVYYSRSGVTARVAKALATRLDADVEEVVDRSDRSGPFGFVRSIIAQMTRICGRHPVAHCKIDSLDFRNGVEPLLLDVFAERLLRKLARAEAREWTC